MPGTAPCPSCAEANDAAQRFCGHCGISLWLNCTSCGQDNPPGFRFCGSCGAPCESKGSSPSGAAEGEDGERRWLTVLFVASRLALASDAKQAPDGAMPWAHVDGIQARLRAASSRAYALNLGSSNHPGARTIAGGRSR